VVVRYADDFVILCDDLDVLLEAKSCAESWLTEMGLQLKAAKTHITHTLNEHEGHTGFDRFASALPSGSTAWASTTLTNATPDTKHSFNQAGKPYNVICAS
jgi:hypothetical protein